VGFFDDGAIDEPFLVVPDVNAAERGGEEDEGEDEDGEVGKPAAEGRVGEEGGGELWSEFLVESAVGGGDGVFAGCSWHGFPRVGCGGYSSGTRDESPSEGGGGNRGF